MAGAESVTRKGHPNQDDVVGCPSRTAGQHRTGSRAYVHGPSRSAGNNIARSDPYMLASTVTLSCQSSTPMRLEDWRAGRSGPSGSSSSRTVAASASGRPAKPPQHRLQRSLFGLQVRMEPAFDGPPQLPEEVLHRVRLLTRNTVAVREADRGSCSLNSAVQRAVEPAADQAQLQLCRHRLLCDFEFRLSIAAPRAWQPWGLCWGIHPATAGGRSFVC